jgi:hypothetical protein
MKAEERHRLAENDLVKGIRRLTSGPKRPPNILLLMIGLLAIVMIVYWYWSSTASNRVARAWRDYFQNKDNIDAPASLRTGPAGQAVILAQADKAYSLAFEALFSSPSQALKDFANVAQQYVDLSKQASNNDIQIRSLVGAARSYESAGKIEEAKQYYDSVLTKFGGQTDWKDHPLVKEAKEHKEKLATGTGSLAGLYASWQEKMSKVTSSEPTPPSLPTIPLPPELEKK